MDKLQPLKNLDIQGILDKIKDLPIDDKDKATILEEIKKNITHPSAGENQNLDNIQSKYSKMNIPSQEQQNSTTQNNTMHYSLQGNSSTPMTSAQFEILKNKLDSLQYELIDLLRHVKDYTQRYMNAVRQQDLDKINEYINGLFEVDKTLKETQALAESDAEEEDEEESETKEQAQKSVITKATSGITNFFGSIGNNVSGITQLVKSTADVANGYLTKKILPSSNSNVNVSSNVKSNNINSYGTSSKTSYTSETKPKSNIVSVDEYINDMNKIEELNNSLKNNLTMNNSSFSNKPINNSNIIKINSNNINSLESGSIQTTQPIQPIQITNSKPDESINLEGALKNLNDTMNQDIEDTVNNNSESIEHNENNEETPNQSGGKRSFKKKTHKIKLSKKENNLTKKKK